MLQEVTDVIQLPSRLQQRPSSAQDVQQLCRHPLVCVPTVGKMCTSATSAGNLLLFHYNFISFVYLLCMLLLFHYLTTYYFYTFYLLSCYGPFYTSYSHPYSRANTELIAHYEGTCMLPSLGQELQLRHVKAMLV